MKFLLSVTAACFMIISSVVSSAAYPGDSIGSAAPDFSLKDLSGGEYNLTGYKGKQAVLLFFWTTWCPYCLQKVKFLNEEYLTLEKNNIALLAINAGEARKLVARLAGRAEIMYKVLLDERGSVSEDYRIVGVPTFILIDKKGIIRYKGNSYPQSDIESVIAQK